MPHSACQIDPLPASRPPPAHHLPRLNCQRGHRETDNVKPDRQWELPRADILAPSQVRMRGAMMISRSRLLGANLIESIVLAPSTAAVAIAPNNAYRLQMRRGGVWTVAIAWVLSLAVVLGAEKPAKEGKLDQKHSYTNRLARE